MRYDLSAQASHWLRQTLPNVSVRREGMTHFSLANGDVDGDEEVSLLDFGVLTRPLGTMGDDEPIPQATRPWRILLLRAPAAADSGDGAKSERPTLYNCRCARNFN